MTVTLSGSIAGSATVTPSDGAGGAFSPTTVTLSNGSPSATTTYTPAALGAFGLTGTNNAGLTNPAPVPYTATNLTVARIGYSGATISFVFSVGYLTTSGGPTGGTLQVTATLPSLAAATAGPIPYNATAAQIQALFDTAFGANNTAVSGGPLNTTSVSVVWIGSYANQAVTVSVDSSGLTGGTLPAVAWTWTAGGPSALTTSPTVQINGGTAQQLSNPISGTGFFAVNYLMPSTVAPTDTVTYTSVSGWVTAVAGFTIPASTAAPVTNLTGPTGTISYASAGYLRPLESTHRVMPLGFNITTVAYFNERFYANRMKECTQNANTVSPYGTVSGTPVFTTDANNALVTLTGGSVGLVPFLCNTANGGTGLTGFPFNASGSYVVMWDGPATSTASGTPDCVQLAAFTGSGGTAAFVSHTLTGTTNNTATYTFTANASFYAPFVEIIVNPFSGGTGVTNIRLYPPGQTVGATWNSNLLRKLQGAQSVRFMEAWNTPNSNNLFYSNFTSPTYMVPSQAVTTMNVVQIDPYTDPTGFFGAQVIYPVYALMTTAAPHGLTSGQSVYMSTNPFTVTFTDATTANYHNYQVVCLVVSPTQFAVPLQKLTTGVTLASAQVVNYTAFMSVLGTIPVADSLGLCQAVGANAHVNVPHGMGNADVTALATAVVASLAPGAFCRVEFTNEHWNSAAAFLSGYIWCAGQGHLNGGLSQDGWYTLRASQVHAIFATVFAAAGRASSLIRVFGSQWSASNVTQNMVNYATATFANCSTIATQTTLTSTSNVFSASDVNRPITGLGLAPGTTIQTYNSATSVTLSVAATGTAGPGTVSTNIQIDEICIAPYLVLYGTVGGSAATWNAMSVDQMLDQFELTVNYFRYTSMVAGHIQILRSAFPAGRVICYEAGPQTAFGAMTAPAVGGTVLQFSQSVQRHPRYAYIIWQYLRNLAANGVSLMTSFETTGGVASPNDWGIYHCDTETAGVGDGSDGLNDNRTNYFALAQLVSPTAYAYNQWAAGTGAPTMTVAPVAVLAGATVAIAVTGTGTAWTPSTLFSVTAGTIVAQTYHSSTAFTLTYAAPAVAGAVALSESTDAATANLTVTGALAGPIRFAPGRFNPFSVRYAAITLTGADIDLTNPSGPTGGYAARSVLIGSTGGILVFCSLDGTDLIAMPVNANAWYPVGMARIYSSADGTTCTPVGVLL